MMPDLQHVTEPALLFRYDQAVDDPRDGLTLFGPLDKGKPYGIRWGMIGPEDSMQRMERWVAGVNTPILSDKPDLARPAFPGFQAVFDIPWTPTPVHRIPVPGEELRSQAFLDDPHQRVFNTVNVYTNRIIDCLRREEVRPDVWCVVIPEYIYTASHK